MRLLVVEGANKVIVILADKEEYEAKIVGRDPKTDLAVLKIEGNQPFPTALLGDSEILRVGDPVIAISNQSGNTMLLAVQRGESRRFVALTSEE